MAVAKKAKASNVKKDTKASNNKKVPSKPAAKPAAKKQPLKSVPAKKAAAAPAKSSAPAKKIQKPSVPVKAKPVSKAVPAKAPSRPAPAPKKAEPVKSAKPEPALKGKPTAVKNTPPPVKAKPAVPAKEAAAKSVKTAAPVPAKAVKSKPEPEKKGNNAKDKKGAAKPGANPGEEFPDMDPADAKAKKIMKELEETMDLAAMKPRIKVPGPVKTVAKHHHAPPLKLVEPTQTNKQKYQLEFEFRSSPKILFNALSDSSGLAGWFADEVKTRDDQFTFVWEGGESYARLVALKDMYLVRFQWAEDTDGTYFQFEIKQDELTGEIALVITDFALPGERETNIRLWESQVQNLRMLLGSL